MSDNVHLIVGLGNPGQRYENTWHNIGVRAVNEIASTYGVQLRPGKGEFHSAEIIEKGKKYVLLFPTGFMNRSGTVVAGWIQYYKIPQKNVLVIFDDHDLPFGRIRLRSAGTSGGHRGMDDIILRTGSDKIQRLKIGIRLNHEIPDLAKQVLSKIPSSINRDVDKVIEIAAKAVDHILNVGFIPAMNYYNGLEIIPLDQE
ncbi:MAG: aminoacyl-tRNA hydrolase [Calditrichaeota bacterium]|jgi:peptidyl-tRNA hydrolase, PTH1 family|nr:aminoacyl-tRNA hydrolase [Calditrichota bacterium]MBT7617006.1 aminoacyl-tRNA hydrolase [Calditrichota bacterium]MBT7788436.1 aminoacyl-tRNA hydrolase [Calditrichota bacterium]